jgi:hypothetical protein
MVLRVLQKGAVGSGASPDSGFLQKKNFILIQSRELKQNKSRANLCMLGMDEKKTFLVLLMKAGFGKRNMEV